MEGQEISVDDEAAWSAVTLLRGQVLEVHFAATNFHTQSDSWGAFLIREIAHLPDGSMVVPGSRQVFRGRRFRCGGCVSSYLQPRGETNPSLPGKTLFRFGRGRQAARDSDSHLDIEWFQGVRVCDSRDVESSRQVDEGKEVSGKSDRRRSNKGGQTSKAQEDSESRTQEVAKGPCKWDLASCGHNKGKKPVEEEDEDDGNGGGAPMTEEKKAELRDRLRGFEIRFFRVERLPRNRTTRTTRRASNLLGRRQNPHLVRWKMV